MTIKANEARNARAEALIQADRVIEAYAYFTVGGLAATSDERLTRVLTALATLRPEAAGDVFAPPPPRTGPVGSLPIRAVTERDATVITACLEFCLRMNEVMAEAGLITVPIGRGEIERILRDLAA